MVKMGDGTTSCIAWDLMLSYNVESLTTISAEISGDSRYCTTKQSEENPMLQDIQQASLSINILVIIVGSISFILSLKHILSVAKIFMSTKILYKQRQAELHKEGKNPVKLYNYNLF